MLEIEPSYVLRELIGFISQAPLFLRWLIQMRATKKAGASVIPLNFWKISAVAGLFGFVYAYLTSSWVLLIALLWGYFIMGFNLKYGGAKNG